jgi:retron-type reverse transcriptase
MVGYEALCDFQNLYAAHKAARKGKRGKTDVIGFEMNLAENLCRLQETLQNRTYRHGGYYRFQVYEPKLRDIFAPRYADRVVQHCLCDNILAPALETRLIYDNAACRARKGTHFAMGRLTGFMTRFYRQHGTSGYFLKCDIRKFFDSIDHAVLKSRLARVFREPDLYALLCQIIDSYQKAPGKGLPLGNQTSQWFALYYLDLSDRLVKERLGIQYYTRYMDDFVLLHHDRAHLRECLARIGAACGDDLKLTLNHKTQIFPIKNGVDYLGWRFYMTDTGKIIRRLRRANKAAMKKRLKGLQSSYAEGRIDLDAVKSSMISTHGHLLYGDTYRLRKKVYGAMVFAHRGESDPHA